MSILFCVNYLEGILPSGAKEVPLDKVYIRLHAITERRRETLREAERDQLKQAIKDIPARSQEDYFSFIQRLGDFYYNQPGSRLYPAEGESIDPEDALKENPRMVILGAPGSGKSTFLRFLARRCASDPRAPIPIMLSLRKYAEHLGNGGEMSLQDFGLKDLGWFEPHLRKAIEDGAKILWLLDGLDEARGWQERIRHSVRDIPGNFILTSRPVGYSREGLEKLPHFEVLPLSPDDTDKFLRDWFGHLSEQLGKPSGWTEERVSWLLDQLSKKKGIEPLAKNPLLLTFLVILAGQDPLVELPERRSEIFEKYVEKLLLSWEDRRLPRQGPAGETSLEVGLFKGSQAQDILLRGFHWIGWFLHLSYYSGCSENVCGSISYRPFREDLEEYLKERLVAEEGLKDSQAKGAAIDIVDFWHGAGILDVWALEGREYLAFRHLAFQEYASASILLDIWRKDPGRAWSFLQPRLHHRAWQQPILLMTGKVDPKEIDSLLQRIRKNHGLWQEALLLLLGGLGKRSPAAIWRMLARGNPYERILHLDLRLCLDVLNECGYANRSRMSRFADQILDQAAEVAANSITWNNPFRNHLLDRNMPTIGPLLDHAGEMKQIFHSSLLPLLKYSEPQVRASATFALGYLGNAQAVPDLMALLKDSDWMVQSLAAEALGKLGDVQAVPELLALLKDPDSGVRRSAAEALGILDDAQAIPDLLALFKDPDIGVRMYAVEALCKLGDAQAVPNLLALLKDSDSWDRIYAAEALGKLGDAQAVPNLLALLKDSDSWDRIYAAEALGKLGAAQAIPDLLALLKDSDLGMGIYFAEALGILGSAQAVPDLMALLKDSDSWVRSSAAKALGRLGAAQAVPDLLALLKDPDSWVRSSATKALGILGSAQAVPDLLALLKDSDSEVRSSAAEALGKLGSAQVVPDLLALLKDSESLVRRDAAEALGKLGDNRAVPDLLALLKDSDDVVRIYAAEALGKLGAAQAVPNLLALLRDFDSWDRIYAAEALGKLGDAQAVPDLLALLKDSEGLVRSTASEALRNFEGIQSDLSMLVLFGHSMLIPSLANIKKKEYAESMFSALEYVSLSTADLMLKEKPLRDALRKDERSGLLGALDSLKISIGLSGPGIGIDLEKLIKWLRHK